MSKVFCIGLPRTGTRSLTAALELLGIRTTHFPDDEETYLRLSNGFYKLPVLETHQGLSDLVATIYYPQFDETYPGSKFILTVRDKASWLESVARRLGGAPEKPGRNRNVSEIKKFFRASLYGSHRFSEQRFGYVYDIFHRNVREYFRDRPGDLLTLDLIGGQGWDVLCPFLALPVPDVPFPKVSRPPREASPEPDPSWLSRVRRAVKAARPG